MAFEAVVFGASAGGLEALKVILPMLPGDFPLPILMVLHRDEKSGDFLGEYLNSICDLNVKEGEDKEPVVGGQVYLAPAGYHLLVEPERVLSLSVDERVNYSCPSLDVLFESAAAVYGAELIGIVATGANTDGAHGLKVIAERGGLTVVQDPATAAACAMPRAALASVEADYVLALDKIVPLLVALTRRKESMYGIAG